MFKDMVKGTGEEKNCYRKVQFCGEQSARANLQHFLDRYMLHFTVHY
jgi:hypothetical protein